MQSQCLVGDEVKFIILNLNTQRHLKIKTYFYTMKQPKKKNMYITKQLATIWGIFQYFNGFYMVKQFFSHNARGIYHQGQNNCYLTKGHGEIQRLLLGASLLSQFQQGSSKLWGAGLSEFEICRAAQWAENSGKYQSHSLESETWLWMTVHSAGEKHRWVKLKSFNWLMSATHVIKGHFLNSKKLIMDTKHMCIIPSEQCLYYCLTKLLGPVVRQANTEN